LIVVDNVVRGGAVVDPSSTDENVRGVRRLTEMIAAEPRVSATAIQTVGSKGHDGFLLALVTSDAASSAADERSRAPGLQTLAALWDEHMRHEFSTRDTEATIATMVRDARVNHVPVMTGGSGHDELRRFYARHFIPQMPPDFEVVPVARTIGTDRLVDEIVVRFTHTVAMDWMLPGVAPTGRRVAVPLVVSVEFRDGQLCNERIYWDQASVLVQVGLLDPAHLPVAGADSAAKVLDPGRPCNELIARAAAR
jgi:carboxymethylenebutenolidase